MRRRLNISTPLRISRSANDSSATVAAESIIRRIARATTGLRTATAYRSRLRPKRRRLDSGRPRIVHSRAYDRRSRQRREDEERSSEMKEETNVVNLLRSPE